MVRWDRNQIDSTGGCVEEQVLLKTGAVALRSVRLLALISRSYNPSEQKRRNSCADT